MYEWAANKGYESIIDLEYRYTRAKGNIGEDNKWEYCFQQSVNARKISEKGYVLIRGIGTGNSWLEETCMDINGSVSDSYIHVKDNDWRNYYSNIYRYAIK